jgi:hypothetical protein
VKEIPPFKLLPEPQSDAAATLPRFKWADPKIGSRHKLGRTPDFLRQAEYPPCSCREPMTFHAQLDSINDEIALADCGMIFVFVCFDCFETRSLLQSA